MRAVQIMMDVLHKLIVFFSSPLTLEVVLLGVGIFFVCRARKRHALICFGVAVGWLWLWSTPLWSRALGLPLEGDYPAQRAEEMPQADLIVVLGGGMDASPDTLPYAEMNAGADRVWHAARLYKAGKAPKIVMTGGDVWASTAPLLRDLGVPEDTLVAFEEAKNTEEEARCLKDYMKESDGTGRILLVTSAWHMRRAEWLFRRAGLDVVPAPSDYEISTKFGKGWRFSEFFPQPVSLSDNCYLFKEHFSYWLYRILKPATRSGQN